MESNVCDIDIPPIGRERSRVSPQLSPFSWGSSARLGPQKRQALRSLSVTAQYLCASLTEWWPRLLAVLFRTT